MPVTLQKKPKMWHRRNHLTNNVMIGGIFFIFFCECAQISLICFLIHFALLGIHQEVSLFTLDIQI